MGQTGCLVCLFGKGVPVLEFYTFCHHSSPITLYPFIGKGYRVCFVVTGRDTECDDKCDESVDKFLVIT